MAAAYPSGTNTFVPSTEASGKLVVDFSRNPNKFALSRYVQYVPVKKSVGLYTEMTVEMAGRVLNSDLADWAWYDGAEAPANIGNLEEFEFKPFACKRFAPGFRVGDLAADQAEWDLLAQAARHATQRMMTGRTLQCITELTTTGNYPSGHTLDVENITDVKGEWDLSTTSRMDIKRSLDYAADVIQKATLAAVEPSEMVLVVGPDVARAIAVTQEIRDHIKHSPAAEKTVKGNLGPQNNYGLPETLYDYPVVVEKTVRVTSRKGATKATSYVLSDDYAIMMSRPGGLEGVEGAPSFSTMTLFLKEELTVESKRDADNRRHVGRVVDHWDPVMTAPISGFLFQNPLSTS